MIKPELEPYDCVFRYDRMGNLLIGLSVPDAIAVIEHTFPGRWIEDQNGTPWFLVTSAKVLPHDELVDARKIATARR